MFWVVIGLTSTCMITSSNGSCIKLLQFSGNKPMLLQNLLVCVSCSFSLAHSSFTVFLPSFFLFGRSSLFCLLGYFNLLVCRWMSCYNTLSTSNWYALLILIIFFQLSLLFYVSLKRLKKRDVFIYWMCPAWRILESIALIFT